MKKILSLGKYSMDGKLLGCGNFGRVELATHVLTNIKVRVFIMAIDLDDCCQGASLVLR